MSYDIHMLRLSTTGDVLQRARSLFREREKEAEPAPENYDWRKGLAADLVALHPSLRMEPFDKGFPYGCVIDTDDPSCHVPYIEIGIDGGLVNFPYSANVDAVFTELQRVIAVFERHGCVAYDPQGDCVLTSAAPADPSSFQATKNSVLEQLSQHGEHVIGFSSPQPRSRKVIGILVFVVLAGTLIALQIYRSQTGPRLSDNDLKRIHRIIGSPNATVDTDARTGDPRGSP